MISGHQRISLKPTAPLLLAALLLASACGKPNASAPTEDFVRRHACPAKSVETIEEGRHRVRVTGCGESDIYVQDCANRSSQGPGEPATPMPLSESEARSSRTSTFAPAEAGCAWSREEKSPDANWRPGGK